MVLTGSALFFAAAAIGIVTIAVGIATMATAVWFHYRGRRRESARKRVQSELFERLFAADPEWNPWVGTLSRVERRQLRTLLDEYLRQLRGTEHDRLCDLGSALGISERAKRNLSTDRKRLRALTWLALLEEPVEPERLERYCRDEPQHRAGAARVLHRSGHPDAPEIGTDLLVGDGERSLTAFGFDTLSQLNNGTETPLLASLEAGSDAWNERLLVQALLVLRHCNISDPGGRLGWLPALLTHDSPRVRAAAVGVLERHGWREQLEREIDIGALLGDVDGAVRRDTYLLLASWGDERSAALLRRALDTEDETDMLALVRALVSHPRIDPSEAPDRFEPFVQWVRADEAVGRRRHVWGVSAAWS